ncbi:MAG: peptidoglycan-binding protein [Rhodobacteraceae bacterium]|nr:peptidoglycan-binding protein [Paracoccaceae bacterium]
MSTQHLIRAITAAATLALLAGCQMAAEPPQATRGAGDTALAARAVSADHALQTRRQCWHAAPEADMRVPCPEELTESFIASLQRALAVRGYMEGDVTGFADPQTIAAVHAFQAARGLDSAVLSYRTGQDLGLLPVDPADL